MGASAYVPYCGQPPVPGSLAWNTDPVLAVILLAVALIYAAAGRRPGGPERSEQALFFSGWAVTVTALMSPLCNLSVALFSARVTQHVVLLLIAAPLIVLGRPEKIGTAFIRRRWSVPTRSRALLGAAGTAAFALALWTWHLPGPYDATLRSDVAYWAMHVTTFGAGLALWHVLLVDNGSESAPAASILGALLTAIQMSLLGALLTLAPRPLFDVHLATTWPWGLSPLQDQQLGGLIMWVPGGLLFMLYFAIAFGAWLRRLELGRIGSPKPSLPVLPSL